MVGGMEKKRVLGGNATWLVIDSPLTGAYTAGTPVQYVPAAMGGAPTGTQGGGSQSSSFTSSSGSSGSSGGYGGLIMLILLCCICLGAAGVGAFLYNKKNKKRKTTDREAYLKNDFIERQPVYQEGEETDPMLKERGRPGLSELSAAVATLENSNMQTFPVQQLEIGVPVGPPPAAPAPPAPTAGQAPMAPSLASFPGMPDIGFGGPGLLQNTAATRPPVQYSATPQAASMNVTMQPYGNYPSQQSAYLSAPSAYSQQVAAMPQTNVQYR